MSFWSVESQRRGDGHGLFDLLLAKGAGWLSWHIEIVLRLRRPETKQHLQCGIGFPTAFWYLTNSLDNLMHSVSFSLGPLKRPLGRGQTRRGAADIINDFRSI